MRVVNDRGVKLAGGWFVREKTSGVEFMQLFRVIKVPLLNFMVKLAEQASIETRKTWLYSSGPKVTAPFF